jgi:hypothetical protein
MVQGIINDFTETFDIHNWIIKRQWGKVDITNAPQTVTLDSGNNYLKSTSSMQITIPFAGSLSFSYNLLSNDIDGLKYDPFGILYNGVKYILANSEQENSKTDTVTIDLQPNDVFGFYIETLDGIGGNASVVISNFKFRQPSDFVFLPLVLQTKIVGESHINIAEPEIGPNFVYTYSSSNPNVASFNGNLLSINSHGSSQITITQKTKFYTIDNTYILLITKKFSGSLTVNQNTMNTPARIYNNDDWNYFLTKNVKYAMLMKNIDIISNNITTPNLINYIVILPFTNLSIV